MEPTPHLTDVFLYFSPFLSMMKIVSFPKCSEKLLNFSKLSMFLIHTLLVLVNSSVDKINEAVKLRNQDFSAPGTIDILDQVILCPVHQRMFRSLPGLYPPDASSPQLRTDVVNKILITFCMHCYAKICHSFVIQFLKQQIRFLHV